jgi:predicted Asp-tRNA(Asn)/Glu-tRNA(Gln) amidotransferase subunit C
MVDQEKIKEEAKEILDKFAEALENVEKENKDESYVDREDFERIEKEGEECEEGFKEKILKNAPEHNDDFILVEKGAWK